MSIGSPIVFASLGHIVYNTTAQNSTTRTSKSIILTIKTTLNIDQYCHSVTRCTGQHFKHRHTVVFLYLVYKSCFSATVNESKTLKKPCFIIWPFSLQFQHFSTIDPVVLLISSKL